MENKNNKYRSGLEESFAKQLVDNGIPFGYEIEKISFTIPARDTKYLVDFRLLKKDGTYMYIETKGQLSSKERKKHLLIQEQHPELDIRFVFGYAKNKINKNSKTTYIDWCEANGFLWADKQLPQAWLEELNYD